MAKNSFLEITYWKREAKANSADFLAQIDDRVAQVKSLIVETNYFPHLPAILNTTSATKLENIRLHVHRGNMSDGNAVPLFGGEPASPALKIFHVAHLPVAPAPLRLSGLRSLGLRNMPIASAQKLLKILMESPALEDCSLGQLDFSTDFTPPEHLRWLLRGKGSIAGANLHAIRLLHLRHLTLSELPISFTHYLLSNMQASNLLSFRVQGELHDSPASELFTADISHLGPALKGSTANADRITINLWDDGSWKLGVGMLNIDFAGVRVEPRHLEETLDWVYVHLGEHLKALPTTLVIVEFDVGPDLILWLGAHSRVTNLILRIGGQPYEWRRIVSLLSRSVAAMSNKWALPDLEVLDSNVIDEAGKWEIVEMVGARHSSVQAQADQGRREVALKPFKEIRLRGRWDGEHAPKAELLSAIEKIWRGVEISWEGATWVWKTCSVTL